MTSPQPNCWFDGGIVSFFGVTGTLSNFDIQPTDGSPVVSLPFMLIGGSLSGGSIRPAMWDVYQLGREKFGDRAAMIVLSPRQAVALCLEGGIGADHLNHRTEGPGYIHLSGVDIRPDIKFRSHIPHQPVLRTVRVVPDPEVRVGVAAADGTLLGRLSPFTAQKQTLI